MWASLICVANLAGGVAATFVAQVVDGDVRTTTRNQFYIMLTTAITSIATLAALILNYWFTARRAAKEREWQVEDRRRQDEREDAARVVRIHAENDRQRMEDKIDVGIAKVDENTEVTKQVSEKADVAAVKSSAADDKLADLRVQFEALKK